MYDNYNTDNILALYDGESRPGLFKEASPEYSNEQRLQSDTEKLNIPVAFKNVVGVPEVAKVSFRATMPNGTPIPDAANVYIVLENGDIIPVSTISSYDKCLKKFRTLCFFCSHLNVDFLVWISQICCLYSKQERPRSDCFL